MGSENHHASRVVRLTPILYCCCKSLLIRFRYILSYLASRLAFRCDVNTLRVVSWFMLSIIAETAFSVQNGQRGTAGERSSADDEPGSKQKQSSSHAILSAANVSLFPPLFFFSALFYTDVPSTCFVLMSYQYMRKSWNAGELRWRSWPITVVLGVVALSFRQTNIFWVAVLPAGLSAVRALKQTAHTVPRDEAKKPKDMLQIVRDSWESSEVYDVAVEDAAFEGITLPPNLDSKTR